MKNKSKLRPRVKEEIGIFNILDIKDRQNAIDVLVQVDKNHCFVSEKLADDLYKVRPDLKKHTCSEKSLNLKGTSMAHAIEHISIDMMVEARAQDLTGSQKSFAGYTVCKNRVNCTYCITLSCDDAGFAYSMFCKACEFVNSLL